MTWPSPEIRNAGSVGGCPTALVVVCPASVLTVALALTTETKPSSTQNWLSRSGRTITVNLVPVVLPFPDGVLTS